MIKFKFLQTFCYFFTLHNCQRLTRSGIKLLWTLILFQNGNHLPFFSSELEPEALPNSYWRSNRRQLWNANNSLIKFSGMLGFIGFTVNWYSFAGVQLGQPVSLSPSVESYIWKRNGSPSQESVFWEKVGRCDGWSAERKLPLGQMQFLDALKREYQMVWGR